MSKTKGIQTVSREIKVNEELLDLEIEVKIEGDVVIRKKGECLLTNFLYALYTQFGYPNANLGYVTSSTTDFDKNTIPVIYSESGANSSFDMDSGTHRMSIGAATVLSGGTVEIGVSSGDRTNQSIDGGKISVQGINGISGANGLWTSRWSGVSGTSIQLVGTSGSGSFAASDAYARGWRIGAEVAGFASPNQFRIFSVWGLRLGLSSHAVEIGDYCLYNMIPDGTSTGMLTHSSHIVTVPAVAGATSTISITRDFTNNSGGAVTFAEVGLFTPVGRDVSLSTWWGLIARDLAGATVNDGTSFEVTYRIRSRSQAAGGMLRQFGEMLYRQLAATTREAKDIDNQNQTVGTSEAQFRGAAGGGFNHVYTFGGSAESILDYEQESRVGPQIGDSATAVDFEDFDLGNRFLHGVSAPDGATTYVFIHGSIVHGYTIAGGQASFKVVRLFENLSGTTLNVREIGMNVSRYSSGHDDIHCISHFTLATTVVLPHTQLLKVEFTYSVTP